MYSKLFWQDTFERAVSTFAQTLIAVLTIAVASGKGFAAVAWVAVISAAALAAVLSVLKSIVALQTSSGNSASFAVDYVKEK